jgi:hypothetical protein
MGAVTVIHHDKVIPCAVHLGELQSHPASIIRNDHNGKDEGAFSRGCEATGE